MYKILFLIIFILLTSAHLFANASNNVGFIWHYPFVENDYTENIVKSGANIMNARVPWILYEQTEGVYNFSDLDKQLAVAKRDGFKLVLILEVNPYCKPIWLKEKCTVAGEMRVDYFGNVNPDSFPSHKSPIYSAALEKFINALTNYINEIDNEHTIIGYQAGIEWWFPINARYNSMEIEAFRDFLTKKYTHIESLNKRYETNYTSFKEISPLMMDLHQIFQRGQEGMAIPFNIANDPRNIAWFNPEPIKNKAEKISFSVDVENKKVAGMGSFIQIAWFKKDKYELVSVDTSTNFSVENGKTKLNLSSVPPEEADSFAVYMLLVGYGNVTFSNPKILMEEKEIHVPKESWNFDPRTKKEDINGEIKDNNIFTINTKDYITKKINLDALAYDWQIFWAKEAGEYINSLAKLVKKYDKERYLMSFTSFNFSYFAEWDFNVWTGVFPDFVYENAKDIDILGMQLTGSEGDSYRIAAGMDLARKYNKLLCNLDLLDFAGGSFVPIEDVIKMTHTSISHGANMILYCNWAGPPELSYQPYYKIENINKMVSQAKEVLNELDDYKVNPKILLVHPFLPISPNDTRGYKNSNASFIGLYKILEKAQITCDIMTFHEMETFDISKYDFIVCPDSPYISDIAFEKIKFVANKLIIFGDFGKFDEIGNIRKNSTIKPYKLSVDYGTQYAGKIVKNGRAGDTPPMIQLTINTEIQKSALEKAMNLLKPIKQNQMINANKDISVTELFSKDGKKAIYIVNQSNEEVELNLNVNDFTANEIISDKKQNKNEKIKFRYFCIIKE